MKRNNVKSLDLSLTYQDIDEKWTNKKSNKHIMERLPNSNWICVKIQQVLADDILERVHLTNSSTL